MSISVNHLIQIVYRNLQRLTDTPVPVSMISNTSIPRVFATVLYQKILYYNLCVIFLAAYNLVCTALCYVRGDFTHTSTCGEARQMTQWIFYFHFGIECEYRKSQEQVVCVLVLFYVRKSSIFGKAPSIHFHPAG